MTEPQLDLLTGQPDHKLTPRQQAILDLLEQVDLLDVDEAGALAHSMKTGRWAHDADTRCDWCARDGRQILEALVGKGLARRRRAPGRGLVYQHATSPGPGPERELPKGLTTGDDWGGF